METPISFVVQITNDGTIYMKGAALTSDRNAKENFQAVDHKSILAKVAALPVTEWNYKNDTADKKHIGPVAQDFHAAFGLNGDDDRHISVVDEGGVALAAIKGLNEKVDEKEATIKVQAAEITDLQQELSQLKQMVNATPARKSTATENKKFLSELVQLSRNDSVALQGEPRSSRPRFFGVSPKTIPERPPPPMAR